MYLQYMIYESAAGRVWTMKHDQLKRDRDFDVVDVAAIWPRPDGGLQVPLGQVEAGLARAPAPAVPDMPVAVGRMIVGVYAAIILAFALTMARGGEASFMIAISAGYVAIFLAVPRIFLAVEADASRRPSLSQFLERGIDTWTGHLSGRAALVQIMIVPLLVLAAISIIGMVGLWVLP